MRQRDGLMSRRRKSARPLCPPNESSTPFLCLILPHECEERGGQRCRCQGGKRERIRAVAGRRELAWAVGLVVGWLRERLRLNAGIGGVIAWVCRSFVKLRRYHVSGALGFVDLAAFGCAAGFRCDGRPLRPVCRCNAHSHVEPASVVEPCAQAGGCCSKHGERLQVHIAEQNVAAGDGRFRHVDAPRQRHGAVASDPKLHVYVGSVHRARSAPVLSNSISRFVSFAGSK